MKATLIILSFIFSLQTLAQVTVRDSETKCPIPYAQVFDNEGHLICYTNSEGTLENNTIKVSELTIRQMAYEPKTIHWDNLTEDTIYLVPTTYKIGNVDVVAKKADYIRLEGYFRSYQLNDSCMKYYQDGIIEFYIPLNKKGHIERNILNKRFLQSDSLIKRDKKRSFSLIDQYTTYPFLEKSNLYQKINSTYKLDKHQNYDIICNNSDTLGYILRNYKDSTIRIEFDNLYPQRNKTTNMFGYVQKLSPFYITEIYNGLGNDYESYIDLQCRKMYRKFMFSHKKEHYQQTIDVFDELFITGKTLITKEEKKEARHKREDNHYSNIIKYRDLYDISSLAPALENSVNKMINSK